MNSWKCRAGPVISGGVGEMAIPADAPQAIRDILEDGLWHRLHVYSEDGKEQEWYLDGVRFALEVKEGEDVNG